MGTAVISPSDEAQLAQAAAAGDGQAFAELYERYEQRAYNLAYRITGSRDDASDATQDAFLNVMSRLPKLKGRDLAFGSYLFTATRNACYDLIERRKRTEPSDELPETAAPLSAGGGFDPGDPEDDPHRKQLLEAQQEEIREANERIPERQREVLALRELEDLSYDEIAEIMGMNRNSVAQLISRARISLRDELRRTALGSVAITSADCERALPLIAARQDGQLDPGSHDADWLADHMSDCHTCGVSREAMAEAGVSYRAWAPIAASPLLFKETMAKAAELAGADWSDVVAERTARGASGNGAGGASGLGGAGAGAAGAGADSAAAAGPRWHKRRDLLLVGALSLVVLVVGFEAATHDDDPPADNALPAATEEPAPAKKPKPKAKNQARKKQRNDQTPAATGDAGATDEPVQPVQTDAPSQPQGGGQTGGGGGQTGGGGGGGGSNPGGGGGGGGTTDPPVVDEPPVVVDPEVPEIPPGRPPRPGGTGPTPGGP